MGKKLDRGYELRLDFLEILMDLKSHRFKEFQKKIGNTMTDNLKNEFEDRGFIKINQEGYKITKEGIDEYGRLNVLEKQKELKKKDAVAINHGNIHFTASSSIPIVRKEEFTRAFSNWVQTGNDLFLEFGLPCGSVLGAYSKEVASLKE